ncbi:unnamed protein product [Orchesella dallaii]|uniref:Uncharacterized protein n=1 Tax=Orchesella dallaii TaxID=48710 RepID=A0ABP1RHC1_9HEXA
MKLLLGKSESKPKPNPSSSSPKEKSSSVSFESSPRRRHKSEPVTPPPSSPQADTPENPDLVNANMAFCIHFNITLPCGGKCPLSVIGWKMHASDDGHKIFMEFSDPSLNNRLVLIEVDPVDLC